MIKLLNVNIELSRLQSYYNIFWIIHINTKH